MLNVGVIFHNNANLVAPFFFFLRKSIKIPYRVIAVNNGSEDATGMLLKGALTSEDGYIPTGQNVGISRARNKIVQEIKDTTGRNGDLVLLDSDVFIVRQESIDRMLTTLNERRGSGIVFGVSHAFNDWRTHETGISFSLIGKEVFDKIGLFDEQFFCYYDDTDFHKRAVMAGFLPMCCKTAICVHAWGTTLWMGGKGKDWTNSVLQKDEAAFNDKWKEGAKWELQEWQRE